MTHPGEDHAAGMVLGMLTQLQPPAWAAPGFILPPSRPPLPPLCLQGQLWASSRHLHALLCLLCVHTGSRSGLAKDKSCIPATSLRRQGAGAGAEVTPRGLGPGGVQPMVGRYHLNFGATCNSSAVWCRSGPGDLNAHPKEGDMCGGGFPWAAPILPHWC